MQKDPKKLMKDYTLKEFLELEQYVDMITSIETARMLDEEERIENMRNKR